jgi:hypothetical protein
MPELTRSNQVRRCASSCSSHGPAVGERDPLPGEAGPGVRRRRMLVYLTDDRRVCRRDGLDSADECFPKASLSQLTESWNSLT